MVFPLGRKGITQWDQLPFFSRDSLRCCCFFFLFIVTEVYFWYCSSLLVLALQFSFHSRCVYNKFVADFVVWWRFCYDSSCCWLDGLVRVENVGYSVFNRTSNSGREKHSVFACVGVLVWVAYTRLFTNFSFRVLRMAAISRKTKGAAARSGSLHCGNELKKVVGGKTTSEEKC